jgi:hypothetical protein
MCHEPHGYSRVSSVMNINYDVRVILHPVHGVVSAEAPVSVETCIFAKHQMFRSDSLGFQHLTVCITSTQLFYKYVLCAYHVCEVTSVGAHTSLATQLQIHSFSLIFVDLPAVLTSTATLLSNSVVVLWKPASGVSETLPVS